MVIEYSDGFVLETTSQTITETNANIERRQGGGKRRNGESTSGRLSIVTVVSVEEGEEPELWRTG